MNDGSNLSQDPSSIVAIVLSIVAGVATTIAAIWKVIVGPTKRKPTRQQPKPDEFSNQTQSQVFSLLPQVVVMLQQCERQISTMHEMQSVFRADHARHDRDMDAMAMDVNSCRDALLLLGPEIRHLHEAINSLSAKIGE